MLTDTEERLSILTTQSCNCSKASDKNRLIILYNDDNKNHY